MIRRKGMAWVEFNNDVYSRNKVRVSKVIIAISGKFTLNAVEKGHVR